MSSYIKNTSTFKKKDARFSDVSIGFGVNPFTKDLTRLTDVDSVKRSIKSLIMTNKHERLLDPDIGGNIRALLFEPMIPLTESIVEDYIKEVIKNYEPRATLISVVVQSNYDNYSLNVTITFKVDTSEQLQVVDFLLERVR